LKRENLFEEESIVFRNGGTAQHAGLVVKLPTFLSLLLITNTQKNKPYKVQYMQTSIKNRSIHQITKYLILFFFPIKKPTVEEGVWE
jgi:hypothetical protein